VDTYIDPQVRNIEAHADVERGIAMAASLASHALEAGLSVGVMTWSDGWQTIAPGRGKRHRRDVLAMLARLPLNMTHGLQELLNESREAVESGATPVVLTRRDVHLGLNDAVRSGLIVLSTKAEQSKRWFSFGAAVEFDRCMPPEQEPMFKSDR
jgi:uncharacterized protein (DUF58 family)